MAQLTVLEALTCAMARALGDDHDVVLLGEDVGTAGGIFRASQGLQQRFGPERVIDTPLDEKGIAAHAVGMALYGLRPIAEIQFSGFIHDAFEQIMFCGAKYRWATAGQYTVPLTVRAPSFGGINGGFWHSQSPEAYYVHGGGMKIVAPSTPADAYGLLLAAIRDPDPTLVLEPVPLYRALRDEVEDDGRAIEIGKAAIVRPGNDLTVITYGPIRHDCQRVAERLAAAGTCEAEVIDLRSLIPFDVETIVASVEKTGRSVIVHEAPQSLGFGAELAATIQARAFGYLEAPVERVAAPDAPYPYGGGDAYYRPGERRIEATIRRTLEFEA
ncbi:MAG: alpha-ketoacid dehydrogenase subunit beta [Alphaproteobacteria bacterium]|jgi:pyruvate/2-oxoglutarate/acetoin dehydrogenase E1 component|nr:alpha-ketoacid dehydrogenase subunit beta [Alphaproteobacteria bacterium]